MKNTMRSVVSGWFNIAVLAVGLDFVTGAAGAQDLSSGDLAGLRFSSIKVDVSHYGNAGLSGFVAPDGGSYARVVASSVLTEARKVFADRLAPGDKRASVLVIRIDNVSMLSISSSTRRGRLGGGPGYTDYMEGAGMILHGGHVVVSHPMLGARDGRDSIDSNERGRLVDLSNYYVLWLKKQMGL